jgi:thioredoxin 1
VKRVVLFFVLAMLISAAGTLRSQSQASKVALRSEASFAPLEAWRLAIIQGNETRLASLYSQDPPAQVVSARGSGGAPDDVQFWTDFHAARMKLKVLKSESPQPGVQQILFEAEVHSRRASSETVLYVTQVQRWMQQSGEWRIVATQRTDPARLEQPVSTDKEIYPADVDAHAEIKEALEKAAAQNKRLILVFGANWCYDCHVLDLAFHRPDLAPVLEKNYVLIHVDIGKGDKNQDLMQQYQVPMAKGIPALAVLDATGKLLVSQKNGEFEKARSMSPEDLLAFLNKWKP